MLIKYFVFCSLFLSSFLAIEANQPHTGPSKIEAKIEEGNRYAKSGNYGHALNALNEAIRLSPNNARAYKLRGHVFYAQGEYSKALGDLNYVVALVPNHPNPLADRAIVYSVLGKHGMALADIEHALALKPDSHFAQAVRKKILEMASSSS